MRWFFVIALLALSVAPSFSAPAPTAEQRYTKYLLDNGVEMADVVGAKVRLVAGPGGEIRVDLWDLPFPPPTPEQLAAVEDAFVVDLPPGRRIKVNGKWRAKTGDEISVEAGQAAEAAVSIDSWTLREKALIEAILKYVNQALEAAGEQGKLTAADIEAEMKASAKGAVDARGNGNPK